MTTDYTSEKEILNKLAQLDAITKSIENTTHIKEHAKTTVMKNTAIEDLLLEIPEDSKEELINRILDIVISEIDFATKTKRKLTKDEKNLREEIGKKTVEVYRNKYGKDNSKEVELNFPGYGTVKCKLKSSIKVTDHNEATKYLYSQKLYQFLNIDISAITKSYKDALDRVEAFDGFEIEENVEASIRKASTTN